MSEYFEDRAEWERVREVGVGDPVTGGGNGTVNISLKTLAGRDQYLLQRLSQCATKEELQAAIDAIDLSPLAPKESPALGGVPTAPTAPPGTDTVQIATTAFAQALGRLLCPPGTIINFAGISVPDGFLPCDGRAVSRTQYAALFAAIGTKWGAGDGSTTFNLPNAIGRFAEGAASAGGYKNAGLPNITGEGVAFHSQTFGQGYYRSGAIETARRNDGGGHNTGPGPGTAFRLDASWSSRVYGSSDTVQPNSYNVLPCIKY